MPKLNILAIILARGGSKAIKKKNLKLISGKPLISYTICEALKSKKIHKVLVSSDDNKILTTAIQYGAIAVKRPSELATDNAKPVECLKHALKVYENFINKKNFYNIVLELLCTNPFKLAEDIDNVIDLHKNTKADSVISVMKLEDHHPIRIKKIVKNKIRDFCLPEVPESRRQDLKPTAYIRNGSIYSVRRDMIEKGIRYGTKNSIAYIMPRERTVNIDEPMDLKIADILMKEKPRKYVKPLISYTKAQKKLSFEMLS